MGKLKDYIILLGASAGLVEGDRWFKRGAESPEGAVQQLVSDLGRDGKDITEALVVKQDGDAVIVTQELRWEVQA